MKKADHTPPVKIHSISEMHRMVGLPGPKHPLISLVDNTLMSVDRDQLPASFLFDFYKISYKKTLKGKIGYGQGYYDFDDGGLVFTAPGQVISILDDDTEYYGLSLLFHADFIQPYALSKTISRMGFFSYDTHEALHLSETEKTVVLDVLGNIGNEITHAIDDFSQDVLISCIELLLNYSKRFYKRQFITRKVVNNDVLARMEQLLNNYFDRNLALQQGLPSVDFLAGELCVSPRYLSDMLRSLTGQNAQQHIHGKLIDKAKEYLSTTNMAVSEVAYLLGFGHPQSFNKLFKNKVQVSPLEFRQSFH